MKKDAFYFPHFCNARHDRKLKRVIKELGVEGYGIYFMLLEVLREQTDFKFPMDDIDLLSDEFGTSEQKVRTVICNYRLFDVDEENRFFSMKLVYYLQPYLEKSERARIAANTRWEATKKRQQIEQIDANAYANAEQMESISSADAMQVKESEVEESKPKNKIFLSDSIEYRLADYLFKYMLKNNPECKQPNIESWAKHIDLMIRIDNRNTDDIKSIIEWCQKDGFWRKNILSTSKLREKFDQLVLNSKEVSSKQNKLNGAYSEPEKDWGF